MKIQVEQAAPLRLSGNTQSLPHQRNASFFPALVAALLGLFFACPASAQEARRYEVRADIDAVNGHVQIAARIFVTHARDAHELTFWVYADRVSSAPHAMGEQNARWIYPGEISLGGFHVSDVSVDGHAASHALVEDARRDVDGSKYRVTLPEGHGDDVVVEWNATLTVPARFGRIGRARDVLSLTGPWYPLLVEDGGFDARHTHHVVVESAENALFVGGKLATGSADVESATTYVPVVVAREFQTRVVQTNARRVRLISPFGFYEPPSARVQGEAGLLDGTRIRWQEHAARGLANVDATCAEFPGACSERALDLVVVPSRVELFALAADSVLVSDHAFEVFPLGATLAFQDRALERVIFRELMRDGVARHEDSTHRMLVSDVIAALLIEADLGRREGRARTPNELLAFASFHPTIDQLLYAPQIPFRETYFSGAEDDDIFREDPWQSFSHQLRGIRFLDLLRDSLGPEKFELLSQRLLSHEIGLDAALRALDVEVAEAALTWPSRPTQHASYRLGDSHSVCSNGACVHHVHIFRDGADVVDPVTIEVVDRDHRKVRGIWWSRAAEGDIELRSSAPLDTVSLDPSAHLLQSAELAEGHPRVDDTNDVPWRPPLLQALDGTYVASERRFDGYLDFAVRRRYDLERAMAFRLNSDARSYGGGARYVVGVGPKRDLNSRIGALSFGGELNRLRAGYAASGVEGWQVAASISGGVDSRVFFVDPRAGYSLQAAARASAVHLDGASWAASVSSSVRASATIPIGLRQALLFVAGGGVTLGKPVPGELQGLGGQFLLRGFETDELIGRGRVFGVAEYRWTALSDLDINFLHLAWVREVQLSGFAGGGAIFSSYYGGDTVPAFAVGGGVRVHFQYGGIQPGVLVIDAGVPLVRKTNLVFDHHGDVLRERAPYALYIGFDQYY